MRRFLVALATLFTLGVTTPALAAQAGCGGSGQTPRLPGETYGIAINYVANTASTEFTATMKANAFFGAEHTFDKRTVAKGTGQNRNFEMIAPTRSPITDHIIIEITSAETGGTVLGRCDITLILGDKDADGDGLFDNWESSGIDVDGGGVDMNLPHADPRRHDLYLEIDCVNASDHSHCPRQTAVEDVAEAFAAAPVSNLDGTTGVQLHVDVGSLYSATMDQNYPGAGGAVSTVGNYSGGGTKFAEAGNERIDWDGAEGRSAANFFSMKSAAFDGANRAFVYRYAIFGHQTTMRKAEFDCTSGVADGLPGNDFLVTLGGTRSAGGADCWSGGIGSRTDQAGTLMHEFGHTLGLHHGGDDEVNNKPNYLSVMNYSFQMCSVRAKPAVGLRGGCDFSRDKLGSLIENAGGTDECAAFDVPYDLGSIDLNGGGGATGASCSPASANAMGDFNGDKVCLEPGGDGTLDTAKTGDDVVAGKNLEDGANRTCDTDVKKSADGKTELDEVKRVKGDVQAASLNGFDDWDGIEWDVRFAPGQQDGFADPPVNESTPETIQQSQEQMESVAGADLAVTKSGPAEATPGDDLDYKLVVRNVGPGPAFDAIVSDTLPDGSKVSFQLGQVDAGAVVEKHVSYRVPVASADGAELVDTAVVSGKSITGNEQAESSNDTARFTTTVRAPKLSLAKSGPASGAPGEALSYALSYENTGGGAAANVLVSDVLPADVYFGAASDAVPAPSSVVRNADGTTVLSWAVGDVPASSGVRTISFVARPSLLASGSVVNSASLAFRDRNDNAYPGLSASATSSLALGPPSRNPLGLGYWANHSGEWTAEQRARIQATDRRWDVNRDGVLSAAEVDSGFSPGGGNDHTLSRQLLALWFNVAGRRVNASTRISSVTAVFLGTATVGGAARYAMATLGLPYTQPNKSRYGNTTGLITEINENKSPRY